MSAYQRQYAPQSVGLNYLGVHGGPAMNFGIFANFRWDKLLWEPFVTREEPRYASPGTDPVTGEPIPGTVWLGVRKMAISAALELCFSFLLTFLTVGAAGGAFAATSNGVLRAAIIGAVHALGRWASVSARYTPHLPRAGDPGMVWYWMWRGEIGLIIGVLYMIAEFGGASLAMLTLGNSGLFASDAWRGATKFGSGAAISDFAAWAYYMSALVIVYWVFGFAQTFTSKRYSYARRFVHAATLQAATIFVLTQFLYHIGIFSCGNPLIYYTGAVGAGVQTVVTGDAMTWVIPIILAPLAAGPVAALFVYLFWNVDMFDPVDKLQGYNLDVLEREAVKQYKDGMTGEETAVPPPYPGGAARTPAGRREDHPPAISNNISADPLSFLFESQHAKQY